MSQLSVTDAPPKQPLPKPAEINLMAASRQLPPDLESDDEKTNLEEGPVTLRWPKKLSEESLEEFDYWVQGLLRRARRKAGLPPKDEKLNAKV